MINKLLGIKSLFLAAIFAVSMLCAAHSASAQLRVPRDDSEFRAVFCANVDIDIAGLRALIDGLADLLAALRMTALDLGGFALQVNPPSLCLPDFNFNLNIPGLDGIMQCLGNFNFNIDIQLPDFGGVADCLAGMLDGLSLQLPDFNPDEMLQCLGDFNMQLDLPSLGIEIANIVRALEQIIAALENIMPTITASFDTASLDGLAVLMRFCNNRGDRATNRRTRWCRR